ncbi:DUF91 domain-containing protein [bacterium]|nr:DUF91 domain-containing protein [bacterium]
MKYWLTTHWPPTIDNKDEVGSGIWLPEDRASAGKRIEPGDLVAVYESQSGKKILKTFSDGHKETIPRIGGRKGIILYGEVLSKISAQQEYPREYYADGTDIWWKWYAPVKILSQSGFLSNKDLCNILGFSKNYSFHGFGEEHSGLKEITQKQFFQIKMEFLNNNPIILPDLKSSGGGPGHDKGGESQDHKDLKQYIASNPELALSEKGIKTIRKEYPFGTGDRADIVLSDNNNCIIGLEVELNVDESDNSGPLQAIKYRRMLEYLTNRTPGDSRSILVAYSISENVKLKCEKYDIETHELPREIVNKWKVNIG